MSDQKQVFVIHGRNDFLRQSMFNFLRTIGLHPLEWSQLVASTGSGSPFVSSILDRAFEQAQAVVALFTPDDIVFLDPKLRHPSDPGYECQPTGQARPNVLFETGMAMGRSPERTILVEIGPIRPFSDVAGRHVVRLSNDASKRKDLASRLQTCGCRTNLTGDDWLTVGDFSVDGSAGARPARMDLLKDQPKTPPL
jgi:predicted nucleotide-binding protein